MPLDQHQLLFRYLIAILTTVAAVVVTLVLRPLLYPFVFSPFLLAVVLAAIYGGRGPGLLTSLFSTAVLSYWFFPPFPPETPADLSHQLMFLIVAIVTALVAGTAYGQRWRAVRQAGENERLRQDAEETAAKSETATREAAAALTRQMAAEQALRGSEAELADFFETASIGMHWVSEDGIILRANQAELDLLGYERHEYLGHHIAEFHVDPQVINDILSRLREGEHLHQYPSRLRCKDGQVKDVQIDSSVYFLNGRFMHTRCFTQDVTTEKQAENAMARLVAIVSSSSDAIVGKTLDGVITSWNAGAEHIFGYSAAEMIGASVFKLIPEELHEAERQVLEWLRQGEVVELADVERIRKDGERIWISLSVSPVRDRLGAITGAASIKRDITERKKAEVERRQNQEQLWLAHQAAGLGTWRWDIGADELRWDDGLRQMFGIQDGEDVTSYGEFIQRVYPEDRAKVNEAVQRALAGTGMLDHEFRIVLPNGEVRYLADLGRVTRAPTGQPLYLAGVCTDVTERTRLENHLRDTQRLQAVGQLAGGIAHEANNQMTVILGAAEFLQRRTDVGPSARGDIEYIQRAAERTAAITQQLLAFSRRQVLQPQNLDLNAVVHAMEPVLRRSLAENHSLVIRQGLRERSIRADPRQLEQVLLNLTLNAKDAMPDGGQLTIETVEVEVREEKATGGVAGGPPDGAYAAVVVKDTGHGMDEATLQRVFEPFFTTKEVGQGTGLGLAVVHGIVTQSGGYVQVDSVVGRGTTFTLYFPIVSSEAISDPAPTAASVSAVQGKVVLVVEDDVVVRGMATRSLADAGYTTLEAPHGRAALKLIHDYKGRLDIVITDIGMPEMDGHELARCLREQRPDLLVMFMSGYGDTSTANPFLQKPFAPDTLVRKVSEVLRTKAQGAGMGPFHG
jgi:two-component system cell cycle sensor histidine kinase/response regulator CckA